MDNYLCSMCYFTTDKENYLIFHIIRKHRHEKNFQVTCTAPSSYYSSKSWPGFRSHYSRKHRKLLDASYIDEAKNNDKLFEKSGVLTDANYIEMQCANFALKLMSKHKLPETSVNDIIESTINFLVFSEEIKEQDQPIPCRFSDALSNFRTGKMREAFFRKNCNYIPPKEVVLGQSLIRKKDTLQRVNECEYIVPFQKSLENYLNQPEVSAEVTQDRGQKDIMEDFCDGTYSSENSVLQQHPNALQILLNTDSLEIVNPIGSHTKKHKIDVFYWTLANIQPQMQSKWSNIHLLGICKTKYLKKHGTKTFLIDFIETLLKLKEGIRMQVCGSERCLYGILIAVLADTPAAAFITEMKQSTSFAKKGCWTCNIYTPEIQTKIRLSDLEERCPVLQRQHCSDLQEMPERLRPYWSKKWGINGTSPLLQLPYLNIAHCTPHDPLHVCLEGFLNYATALILQIGLEAKLFTINWINANC